MQSTKLRSTALNYACSGDDPSLEIVKLFVEKGGRKVRMMRDNGGETAIDGVEDKEGEIYKYLINAQDCPFHAHCSTNYATLSTIQEHINEHGPRCLFQNNDTKMLPLYTLSTSKSVNQHHLKLSNYSSQK